MNDGFLLGLTNACKKGGVMPRVCLLLLAAVFGCGRVEMGSVHQEKPVGDGAPSAESLVGTVGETSLVEEGVSQHPRRIIYTASIELIVEEFEGVPGKVAELAEKFGGYVASSSIQGQPGCPRLGTWTLRVPVAQYADLLSEAHELGEFHSLTSNSQDVSEEYYDVEARIRNKQKTESRMIGLLEESAGNLEQVLEVEQKLDRVREEIERMQGRLRVLADQTALATVTVTVEQIRGYEPAEEATYGTRVRRAFRGSLHALATAVVEFSIVLVALSPWIAALLVLGLIGAPIVLISRRIRRQVRGKNSPLEPSLTAEVVDET